MALVKLNQPAIRYRKTKKRNNTKKNYLSNHSLLEQIELSKLSYCEYTDERYKFYDAIIEEQLISTPEEIKKLDKNLVYRIYTERHLPDYIIQNKKKKNKRDADGNNILEKLKFPSFQHFIIEEDNSIKSVLKSHWRGGITQGEFYQNQGKITKTLGDQILLMARRLATRGNFRGYSYIEEMEATAILLGIENILKFNENKSDNPFAYLTQIMYNSFVGYLNDEKKEQSKKDYLRETHLNLISTSRKISQEFKNED